MLGLGGFIKAPIGCKEYAIGINGPYPIVTRIHNCLYGELKLANRVFKQALLGNVENEHAQTIGRFVTTNAQPLFFMGIVVLGNVAWFLPCLFQERFPPGTIPTTQYLQSICTNDFLLIHLQILLQCRIEKVDFPVVANAQYHVGHALKQAFQPFLGCYSGSFSLYRLMGAHDKMDHCRPCFLFYFADKFFYPNDTARLVTVLLQKFHHPNGWRHNFQFMVVHGFQHFSVKTIQICSCLIRRQYFSNTFAGNQHCIWIVHK